MTTTVFLVRHASHGHLGRVLSGRTPGLGLTEAGRAEAGRTANRLRGCRAAAVYASPQLRAQQTAAPIAAALGVQVETEDALNEIDFGDWTGRTFDQLEDDPGWQRWNQARSLHRPPGGECMLDVQSRLASWLSRTAARHPEGSVVAVSHADVIKAALAHALGLSLDHHDRFEIGPASVSILSCGGWGYKVQSMNETPA